MEMLNSGVGPQSFGLPAKKLEVAARVPGGQIGHERVPAGWSRSSWTADKVKSILSAKGGEK
jgi:hypothetical protein